MTLKTAVSVDSGGQTLVGSNSRKKQKEEFQTMSRDNYFKEFP